MKKNITITSWPVYPVIPVGQRDNKERFTFHKIRENEELQWKSKHSFRMLFLRKGKGQIKIREANFIQLDERECILVDKAEFYAATNCELVVWLFNENFDPVDRAFFRTLQPQVILQPLSGFPVTMEPAIDSLLELLFSYQQDGLIEQEILYELKQRELLLLFRHYYDPEELAALFYPLLCCLNNFREQILEHFHQVKNTGELIERLGMKRTSFERKFRQHFGTSAHQWLLQQKAAAVRTTLQEGRFSLNEIRKMYGFNSATHFVRFCRRQLGAPPSQLRNSLFTRQGNPSGTA